MLIYLSVDAPEDSMSMKMPIIGKEMDAAKLPIPPITLNPKAPLSGIFSETNPNMVGQKKHTPTANTPAARNVDVPVE